MVLDNWGSIARWTAPGCDHRRRRGDEPGGQPTSNPHAAASFNPMQ